MRKALAQRLALPICARKSARHCYSAAVAVVGSLYHCCSAAAAVHTLDVACTTALVLLLMLRCSLYYCYSTTLTL